MSSLKTALERAKAERQMSEGQMEDRFSAPSEIQIHLEKPHPDEVVKPIEYTQTNVVKVSEENLLRNRIVAMSNENRVSDQFKLLRTQIFQRTRPRKWRTIQVSGFEADEGKSLVAANLAVSIANDTRQTTLLVDLDFRNPSVHKLLDLDRDLPGLKSYFMDGVPLEELFVNPGINKLTVLPAGYKIANATEILGSSRMEALIRELKHRYDDRYIIFDTPGINVCPDPLVISEYVDCMLLVARMDKTPQEAIKAVMERVPKEKVLGVVVNDGPLDATTYYR
jgi:non-specific protein-tyrosine kinase